MGAHLKKQNIFFYLSLLCSVAIIVLMFLPWISFTARDGSQVTASLFPDFITKCLDQNKLQVDGAIDALIFLIPVGLLVVGIHLFYIISALRPNHEVNFPGTLTVLLAGVMMIVFVLTTDIAYEMLTVVRDDMKTNNFIKFIGADRWTWAPVTWFLITVVQKVVFARFAHKKAPERK